MVASVGSSYNVLTLFQTGTGSPSTAKPEAVDAIIEKVRQLKAASSPAYLQASSFATDAWIGSSTEEASSSAPKATAADSAATATKGTASGTKEIMISAVDDIFSSVAIYNHWLTNQAGVQKSLASYKAQLEVATDSTQQERLTQIVGEIQEIIPRDAEKYQELGRQIAAFQTTSGMPIAGTLVEAQDDGTFKVGAFSVAYDGKTYMEHDGSGTARKYNDAGALKTTYDVVTGYATDTGVGFW
ncbi:hypothetical protein [Azorhizobium sp. AG788]|uniref:hypothetical protein n=1 Tax=Azorhizobium sp. AG788 TaxID=2183897 RepID=UPI00313945EB